MDRSRGPIAAIAALIAAIAVIVIFYKVTGLGHFIIVHNAISMSHSWFNTAVVVAVLVLACVAAYVASQLESIGRAVAAVLAVALFIAFVPLARWDFRSGFEGLARYSANVTNVTSDLPSYDVRLNRETAKQLIDSQIDATGDRSDPTSVPNLPGGRSGWCSLIVKGFPGFFNKRFTTGVTCLIIADDGTTSIHTGTFDKRIPSGSGSMSANMKGELTELDEGLYLSDFDLDAYGYLDEQDRPYAVVPTAEWAGHRHAAKMPAVVVQYTPDGVRHSFDTLAAGQIPGPVVPPSVAAEVRESLNATNGYKAWNNPTTNPDAVQMVGNDETLLARSDGRLVYVTALTRYGSGQLVTTFIEVEADAWNRGSAPKATRYTLTVPYTSLDAIEHNIATLYDSDLSINGADGYKIFEITPSDTGRMAATIGKGTTTNYRVEITAAQASGGLPSKICIYPFSEHTPEPGTEIRCDTPRNGAYTPVPLGSIIGFGSGASSQGSGGTTADPSSKLAPFSDAEIFAEAARRAAARSTETTATTTPAVAG